MGKQGTNQNTEAWFSELLILFAHMGGHVNKATGREVRSRSSALALETGG